MRILSQLQEQALHEERGLLSELNAALLQYGAAPEDQDTLARSIRHLDEFFLLVVVGEFNAGKSSLINALLGQKLLKEGVTPTTTQVNILRYVDAVEPVSFVQNADNEQGGELVIGANAPLLRELSIVDTPGTNAVLREHEKITTEFIPRADMVLFITSVDRPFTESERQFLELIRDWGKKVLIVLNKADILQSEDELHEVRRFVTANAQELFGLSPDIFPVSARLALRAKLGEPSFWQASRFEALESFIQTTLDQESRIRLKLLNPLGVGSALAAKFLKITDERLVMLKIDLGKLQEVEAQLKQYQEDMHRDFRFRISDVEKVLFEMEQRGTNYFDDTMRLARVFDLLDKERIRQEFAQAVVESAPQQIETKVNEMIDWLVDSDFRQWQSVMERIAERKASQSAASGAELALGAPGVGTFHAERERLIGAVGRKAQEVVETYDRAQEAMLIADGAQTAVAALAAVEVGAVGLGALITVLATTAAADISGVLLASVVAALGLLVIPARKKQAKADLSAKLAALRAQLTEALKNQFEHEIGRSVKNVNEAISPYSGFVHSEQNKLSETRSGLERIRQGLEALRTRIEEMKQ